MLRTIPSLSLDATSNLRECGPHPTLPTRPSTSARPEAPSNATLRDATPRDATPRDVGYLDLTDHSS
eukprot:CAMPEP_0181205378 /NCGR_PEP_ID=MMETSP1096-20121128/20442_1 /TAXON_ID=156174 ORGANISM="Chrysochromulina ericina, Strain CCMP281" /NCGR_SAMPLE_ID=MMETSP1096 /ASSEMBLY_ACC=CAM_ASM_000453 /LENGTH=66 /DNA_ID=CAMNT_0023296151 /DNA_START=138 /DNA_END=335 /DNA_ORIENTATION=-